MKILVTNHSLKKLGGSETFTFTLVKELCRRKHNVHVYSPTYGYTSDKIKEFTTAKIIDFPEPSYDLILSSHNNTLVKLLKEDINGYKIHTSHGSINSLERSIEGGDHYVAISEEVQKSLDERGIKSTVIHNGVDVDRFKIKNPINKEIKTIGCLCQGTEALTNIRNLCLKTDREFISIHKTMDVVWNVEDYINKCDLIVSLGRGVLEAIACGRNVLVYDSRRYMENYTDGMLTPENIFQLKQNNFSGRYNKNIIETTDQIENYIKEYDQSYSKYFRSIAIKNFNIIRQVDKYLEIYYHR